jgi:transcriptional regulator with XRE-family HTH domain
MATISANDRTRVRLRELRKQSEMSLEEVGKRAGMAASTVSRLESGKRRLTLDHLPPLARALRTTVDALLAPPEGGDPRVRGRPFTRYGIKFVPLTRAGAGNGMHAYKLIYPSEPRDSKPTVHEGHEWIYVLSGRLRLVLGEEDFVLEPGEAAEFSCRVPHWLGAVGGATEALAIFGPQGERVHVRGRAESGEAR